jgi:hypothetical protein
MTNKSKIVTTNIAVKLHPMGTPNYVMEATEHGSSPRSIPLKDLSAEVLAALCDDFRAKIFRKAKKNDPAKKVR